MMNDNIRLESSWKKILGPEFEKPYMQALRNFLLQEKRENKTLYPKGDDIFAAFNYTPFDRVKVVILGQDPYHGIGQAHGLCFSVQDGVKTPPSLQNIYKELVADEAFKPVRHGCLTEWADQGVLLLNSVLTVAHNQPASHQGKGWEQFTDAVIAKLNASTEHLVFMLWGSYAKQKGQFIDRQKHCVLTAAHPSPFSARAFLGCRHFSKANAYLKSTGQEPIRWQLSEQPLPAHPCVLKEDFQR
jgi:uracil-DNA glycosylase